MMRIPLPFSRGLAAIILSGGLLCSCGSWFAGGLAADEAEKPSAEDRGTVLFETKILPVLTNSCYECHSKGTDNTEGGLELDSPSGMLRGGDSGPMFSAHHADQSQLLRMLRHEDDVSAMPPEEKLPDEVIATFEEWIRIGAPDSRQSVGPTAKEERMQQGKQHWAFQPPRPVTVPEVADTLWVRDPSIDTFVLARMEAKGIKPAADANRKTLIRRLFFDLIGIPPSPSDIDAFVSDPSPDALEKLVDRLLDSPQFGERWGRHWLDVVRYAESSGMEFNFTYPHAWPYRNYVIDAFNADKPFDEFLREQIAGDLMPSDPKESAAEVEAKKIAPSVLAFGPKRHNSSGTEFQMDIADDQINVVFKSTMAITVSCARCHDHKFDPIPTKDYYALAGIFLSTEPLYGTIKQKYSNTPTDLIPLGEGGQAIHDAAEAHDQTVAATEKKLVGLRETLKKAAEAEQLATADRKSAEGLLAAITSRLQASAGTATSNDPAVADTSAADAEKLELEQAAAKAAETAARLTTLQADVTTQKGAITKLESEIAELKKNSPERPAYGMSVRDRAKPKDTKLALRGNFRDPGEVVPRGFLSAVNVPGTKPVDTAHSGRLELADWIASPNNPLTARVMANRIWHHLLGRGIVPSVDNFGVIGKPPSHPQLLDSLALRFIADGWSVKRLVRTIVLSRVYQLSSHVVAKNMEMDPDNRLLWRASPRRLEAEAIRDAILAVSGRLDLQRLETSTVTGLGDKLVRGIAMDKIQPASNRRSVYLPIVRDYVPELFDLFDFPSPSLVNGQRAATNVPSQALFLRNSEFVAQQAKLAAQRLVAATESTDDAGRVALAMRWSLGRVPSDSEQAAALQLVHDMRHREGQESSSDSQQGGSEEMEVDAWTAWFLTLFSTAEFRYLVDIGT